MGNKLHTDRARKGKERVIREDESLNSICLACVKIIRVSLLFFLSRLHAFLCVFIYKDPPVALHIHAISLSANQVAAVQCMQSYSYRSRASVILTVAWLLVSECLCCVFQKLLISLKLYAKYSLEITQNCALNKTHPTCGKELVSVDRKATKLQQLK